MERVEPIGLVGVLFALMGGLGGLLDWCFGGLAALAPYADALGRPEAGARPAAEAVQEPAADPDPLADPLAEARRAVAEALRADGVELDLEAGVASLEARVLTRFQALEYLLVGPRGQGHESLFGTEAVPSSLNVALLTLGCEPGLNLRWVEAEPQVDPLAEGAGDERERQASEAWRDRDLRVLPPEGRPVYLHAGWRVGEEVYFYRVEDLIADVENGRAMPRQGFVYLGSKMLSVRDGEAPVFAADHFQNLVNLALFPEGHTLLTSRLRAAVSDDIWFPNTWLLPTEDQPVRLVIADRPLAQPPASVLALLPQARLPEPEPAEDE